MITVFKGKTRLIILSSVVTAIIVVGSLFTFGVIRTKVPGDPSSYVVDICGPSATPGLGNGNSGLLQCADSQGTIAWGVNDCTGNCQFGPGTTRLPLDLEITFTMIANGCGCSNPGGTFNVIVNNGQLGSVFLPNPSVPYGAGSVSSITFFVPQSGTVSIFVGQLASIGGSGGLGALFSTSPVSGMINPSGVYGLTNGVNMLSYNFVAGPGGYPPLVRGIRAVIAVAP